MDVGIMEVGVAAFSRVSVDKAGRGPAVVVVVGKGAGDIDKG